jgi:hypothetical protein
MFGDKSLKRIFRSRWSAVWWSLGILFTAWQMTPEPDESESPAVAAAPAHYVSPWDKDPTP